MPDTKPEKEPSVLATLTRLNSKINNCEETIRILTRTNAPAAEIARIDRLRQETEGTRDELEAMVLRASSARNGGVS